LLKYYESEGEFMKNNYTLLTLSLLLLSACQPVAVNTPLESPAPALPSAQPTLPDISPSPSPAEPGDVSESPPPDPGSGGVVTTPSVPLPAGLVSIRVEIAERFLNGEGDTTRFRVVGLDAAGQPLSGALPLSFTLSRPEDFRIDADGLATALKDFGFSEVIIRVIGTDLEARTILSVSLPSTYSGGGGGGGGGSTPSDPPPTHSAVGSVDYSAIEFESELE
jgi:hypothetical protein